MRGIIIGVTLFLTWTYPAHAVSEIGEKAQSKVLNNEGKEIGTALYAQGNQGVLIEIEIKGLPAGKHGMHFHEKGICSDTHDFKMAGGHIMPTNKPHGYLNPEGPHEGNLPNLIVGQDGSAHVELYTDLISISGRGGKPALLDKDGSALMIHQHIDDHTSQPIGGSGARIACGVVKGN